MRFLLLIILINLISCTTAHVTMAPKPVPINYINPKVDPILKNFIYEANARGFLIDLDYLSMNFGDIRDKPTSQVVGYCMKFVSGRMQIMFHTPAWDFMDDYEQEALVFHELGHCLLSRNDHCDNRSDKMGGPISLMNTWVLNGKYYKDHREELLDELFNPDPKCVADDEHVDAVDGEVCSPETRDPKR